MIPSMPLAVAFAHAAVVSPTDPIAVSAIAKRVPIPKRMMHILEGESLLNDASGLVCLRFAIAAALTGAFSIQDAAFNFLRSEEHTSELQSLLRISYAVFCLKQTKKNQ